jgi:hypothetical protein
MQTLIDDGRGGDGELPPWSRVSRARSHVWVRCARNGGARRLTFASAWALRPERRLADALARG